MDSLTRPDQAGGHRVAGGLEGDETVLTDPPQMPLRHQIRPLRQRSQRGPVRLSAGGDDLPVGAMDLSPADRQPSREGAVELGDRIETAASQHMVADDVHLPFDPTLPGRPIGGQHIDGEAVMVGERRRFWVQRHRDPGCDMTADDSLGAVVDNRTRDTAEVGEASAVAVPERREIHPCWW